MKQGIIILIAILSIIDTFANVNFIHIAKISTERKLIVAFNFIKDNQQYFDHWTNKWNYNKSKEELVTALHDHYSAFSAIAPKNAELFLMLGDISHYLYNLDDNAYNRLAVGNYDSAIKINPNDYRAYWFLGYHYSLSNVPNKAIDNFLKAQELLPNKKPSVYWNDYAWATGVANMPSHCIYAMEQVKSLTGQSGTFEKQLGESIHKRITEVDKNTNYKKEDIWTASTGEKSTFTCRPLGVKILIDSTWNLSALDFTNRQCGFIINPPTVRNKNGQEIHYTVALLMKVTDDEDKLEDYLNKLVSKYPKRQKIAFSDKYDNIIAYEIKDKTMYQDIGGAHMYMIGIEKSSPRYPGLILETPVNLPQGGKEQVVYYRPTNSKNRFKERIFYALILDSCEDIHETSLKIFKTLFDNQIIIE